MKQYTNGGSPNIQEPSSDRHILRQATRTPEVHEPALYFLTRNRRAPLKVSFSRRLLPTMSARGNCPVDLMFQQRPYLNSPLRKEESSLAKTELEMLECVLRGGGEPFATS